MNIADLVLYYYLTLGVIIWVQCHPALAPTCPCLLCNQKRGISRVHSVIPLNQGAIHNSKGLPDIFSDLPKRR